MYSLVAEMAGVTLLTTVWNKVTVAAFRTAALSFIIIYYLLLVV